jgi:hypothetical protein
VSNHEVAYLVVACAVGLLRSLASRRRTGRRRAGSDGLSRRQWYRTVYLHSRHWRTFRAAWWSSHPGEACGFCGEAGGRMDLHHVTYERLGHERDTDVRAAHRACHVAHHGH